jgi:hypothetical protein
MLTRNGEPIEHSERNELTRGEIDSFNEAYDLIREELVSLQRVKENVRDLAKNAATFAIPQGATVAGIVEIPNVPADRWQIRSALLKLNNSEILLCDRTVGGQQEFAVVQRFHAASPYAQANGNAEVLLAGRDPVFLVEAYAEGAQHTLRAMANNLLAKAHRTVWERFANTSPVRVIRAISEKCAQAASLNQDAEQTQTVSRSVPRRAIGHHA